MRRAAKIDANQPELVKGLRGHGYSVAITSMVGNGFPDVVVSSEWANMLVEIKDPAKPPSARKLTKDQVTFHSNWKGPIMVAETWQQVVVEMEKLKPGLS